MPPADTTRGSWTGYVREVQRAGAGADPSSVMAGVVLALSRATGWPVPPPLRLSPEGTAVAAEVAELVVPAPLAEPWLLGRVHEALVQPAARRAGGVHYTPEVLARRLVEWTASGHRWPAPAATTVCDPAVGGGAFLLAAADWLLEQGAEPATIVDELWGVDVDPVAVAVAEAAVALWAWRAGAGCVPVAGHLATGDALLQGSAVWTSPPPDGFHLVVGNPPFQGQLGRATARSPDSSAVLRSRLGTAVAGYVDSAALFLVAACAMARPGGRIGLIQPMAVLSARDATGARATVLEQADLDGLWVAPQSVFRAGVRVGAVIVERRSTGGGQRDTNTVVRRATGLEFTPLPAVAVDRERLRSAPSWSHLAAAAFGTPDVSLPSDTGRLGDCATATAGFRDQFYGLAPFVGESGGDAGDAADGRPRLVTSGLIDPLRCRWGEADCRFAGRSWHRPVLDLSALRAVDPRLAQWVDAVLVPKLLVAAQTRVIEAVVDVDARLVPSVPVIAVMADADRLWHLAAVVHAPAVSAWALQRAGGAALAADTIKLAARQLLEVPLPADRAAWAEGASLLRDPEPDHARYAATMNRAYGLPADHDVGDWWLSRLPRRPTGSLQP